MSRRWANLAASSVDRDISERGLAVCSDRSVFGSLYCFPSLFSLPCPQDHEYIALARLSLVSPLKNGALSDGFQVFFTNPPGCRQLAGSRLGLEVN